jgi:hypothetical protein
VLGDEQAQNGERLKRLKNSETYKLRKLRRKETIRFAGEML